MDEQPREKHLDIGARYLVIEPGKMSVECIAISTTHLRVCAGSLADYFDISSTISLHWIREQNLQVGRIQ